MRIKMAESEGNSVTDSMIITIKAIKGEFDIEVAGNTAVQDLKVDVAKQFDCTLEQVCLIFDGKMLKDNEQLDNLGITNGMIIYLVIKRPTAVQFVPIKVNGKHKIMTYVLNYSFYWCLSNKAAGAAEPNTSQSQSDPSQLLTGQTGMEGIQGASGLGLGPGTLLDMQQRLQRELTNKPGMLVQLLENPFVQQIMSNPDMMRQLMIGNPLMKDLLERHPEIHQMLDDPEVLQQTAEMARNPNRIVQEMMRAQNPGRRNFEISPDVNYLYRFYGDLQESSMNAAQESMGFNTVSSFLNSASESGENFSDLQAMMLQMMQSPQMRQSMQSMMQAPYMQSMVQAMAANPEMAQQVIGSSPILGDDEKFIEQYSAQLPVMMQQLNNLEVQSAVSNPRVVEAFMQIQQGMQVLKEESPGIASGLSAQSGQSTTAQGTALDTSPSSSPVKPTSTTAIPPSSSATASAAQIGGQQVFNNMMSQLAGMMEGGQINQPPAQRYASQLEQLAAMGFQDQQANLTALTATLGDVPSAIDRLCQQR